MNSNTTVNNLHTLVCLVTSMLTMVGLTLPADQVASLEKGILALIGIVGFISSWIVSHRHHAATQIPGIAAGPAAPAGVPPGGSSSSAGATAAVLAFFFGILIFSPGCAIFDPPLPGQTVSAPFLAFTNGSAYLLGHPATSNEVYTLALVASKTGAAALVKDIPAATNYLPDAQLVLDDIADAGVFSESELTNALGQIPLTNAADGQIIDSITSSALSLTGLYVGPLATGGTNAGPFVKAALQGIADGL